MYTDLLQNRRSIRRFMDQDCVNVKMEDCSIAAIQDYVAELLGLKL